MPLTNSDYAELKKHIFGSTSLQADEAADDSDKTLTVPAAMSWEIQSIWIELTTTATVGNRQVAIRLTDSADDVIAEVAAGVVQAESLTRNYLFGPGLPDLTSFRAGDLLMTPLPPLVLPTGYKIRVLDTAVVAAAADDMIVQALVTEREPK
jgi:hypothetical protein